MRYNHILTVTVNAPDTIGCTDVSGRVVQESVQRALNGVAAQTNRENGSDVRVTVGAAETTEAETETIVTGGATAPLNMDNVSDETIVNAINGLAETVARLTALAERAERYLG